MSCVSSVVFGSYELSS